MRLDFGVGRVHRIAAPDVEVVGARCEVNNAVAVAAVVLGTSIAVAERSAATVAVASAVGRIGSELQSSCLAEPPWELFRIEVVRTQLVG
jgi:hypothetical protein